MNSSEEIQLGRELRQLAADQPFPPDLSEIGQRARHRHRRALVLRGASAAVAAAVVGVGGFLAFHGTGGSTAAPSAAPAPSAKTSAAAPRAETVAYVTARVETALANVNDYVPRIDQVETGPGVHTATIWTDPRTGNAYEILHDSTNGTSVAWLSTYLVNRVLTWKTVEADYSDRAWFVSVIQAAGPIQGSTAGVTSNVMTPAQIKSMLDAGRLKITGHQEINGHQAIGLRQPWARGYRELWVDSTSFLPLRTITADFANTSGPLKNVQLIDNETWLPRSTSLLNMVNQVHIPAGFHKVAPPQ